MRLKTKYFLGISTLAILIFGFIGVISCKDVSASEKSITPCRHIFVGEHYYSTSQEGSYTHQVLVAEYPTQPEHNEYETCTVIVEREHYRGKCTYCNMYGNYDSAVYEVREHSCVFCDNERVKIQ